MSWISKSVEKLADKFGYIRKTAVRGNTANILATFETIGSAYVAPSISGIGPSKALLTEWWFNPIWGQPRLADLRTIKTLARGLIGSTCIEAILDQMMQLEWQIIPIDLRHPNKGNTQQQIDRCAEFFAHPNRNNESFDVILRKMLRNILETDDGTLVHVFDEYIRPPAPKVQYAATGDIRAYTAQPAWDQIPAPGANLIEIYAEDGSSFLKQVDMHGYLMNYWQYSFTVPRRPVRFEPHEITYVMQNPRAGSPYGYSPFESLVDTLNFMVNAIRYSERFYENSGIPALHIDFPWIKDPSELRTMAEFLANNFVGPDKAYRTLVTNGGVIVKTINFTHEQLQNLQLQNFYLKLVMAKLKVMPDLLGFEQGPKAGVGTHMALFRNRVIRPLMKLVEFAINQNIIPLILQNEQEIYVRWAYVPMIDLDEEERRARIDQIYLAQGKMTINELRLRDKQDPVSWGNEPFIPAAGLLGGLAPISLKQRTLPEQLRQGQLAPYPDYERPSEKGPHKTPSEAPAWQGMDVTGEGGYEEPRYLVDPLKAMMKTVKNRLDKGENHKEIEYDTQREVRALLTNLGIPDHRAKLIETRFMTLVKNQIAKYAS